MTPVARAGVTKPVWTARPADHGSITVEAAVGLCSLLVVFAFVLAGVAAVIGQLRCTDAAGAAARRVARGEWQQAQAIVDRIAPDDSRLVLRDEGNGVTVEVVSRPIGGLLPGVELRGEAYAVLEPGVAPPPAGAEVDDATRP